MWERLSGVFNEGYDYRAMHSTGSRDQQGRLFYSIEYDDLIQPNFNYERDGSQRLVSLAFLLDPSTVRTGSTMRTGSTVRTGSTMRTMRAGRAMRAGSTIRISGKQERRL